MEWLEAWLDPRNEWLWAVAVPVAFTALFLVVFAVSSVVGWLRGGTSNEPVRGPRSAAADNRPD